MAEQTTYDHCGHCGAVIRQTDGTWKHIRLGIPDVVSCDWFDETHEQTVANPEGPLTAEEPDVVRIYGASDDVVVVEGLPGTDEFDAYSEGLIAWYGVLAAPDGGGLCVLAIYRDCWAFAVSHADGYGPLPAWPIQISQHPDAPHSTLLEITAPAGTRLINVSPEVQHG